MSTKVLTAFFEQLLSCKVLLLPYDYYLQIKLLSPVNCKNFYSALRFLRKSFFGQLSVCLLYTSPSPRDGLLSRMPSSA